MTHVETLVLANAEWEAQGHSIYHHSTFYFVDQFCRHYVKMIHNGIEHGMTYVEILSNERI